MANRNLLCTALVASLGVLASALPATAAQRDSAQLAQAGPALPADVQAQINAAIASGNQQTVSSTIQALIAANPGFANQIVGYAVAQAPSDAPAIALGAALAVQAQGGDPAAITLVIVADLEALVQPAAGSGATGLTNDQVTTLVDEVVAQVSGSVALTAAQRAELGAGTNINLLIPYTPPPIILPPPASQH